MQLEIHNQKKKKDKKIDACSLFCCFQYTLYVPQQLDLENGPNHVLKLESLYLKPRVISSIELGDCNLINNVKRLNNVSNLKNLDHFNKIFY